MRIKRKKKEADLTLKGHLVELRWRLVKSVIAVAITTGISWLRARLGFNYESSVTGCS